LAREVNLSLSGRRIEFICVAVLAVIVLRGVVATTTPLSYDEAYYWLWSRHLASGYYDHPPLIAFLIRGGTALFGDTSIGVRLLPWLLSATASLAVWRAGAILLKNEYAGALAALIFNLMPMVGVESLVATPDAPQIAAAAWLMLALAKVAETGRGPWWIAAGIAAGFALLSKYTAFFLGAGILVWLALVPEQRRWFASFWPYIGATIALLMFLPVVLWNAEHGWVSFAAQFGRLEAGGFTLRYLGEFLAGQVALATPFIAILGIAGIVMILRSRDAMHSERALLVAMIAPATLYFLWHSLHDRVQGNWPSFLYPALAIAASAACLHVAESGGSSVLRFSRRVAVPLAAFMLALIYAQALWGVVPRVRDPVSRLLAVGMNRVVDDIESLRERMRADTILTTNYALTGWLSFYMSTHPPIVQINERFRYMNEPSPAPSLFAGPMLYVTEMRNDQASLLAMRFARVTPLAHIARYRNGATIDEYAVYSVEGLKGEPFF
jgi:4-amino-4-deoxy-L-arabinose transferase-like glycosyltransferase